MTTSKKLVQKIVQFDYNGTAHAYEIPFTRPYTNKENGVFANLLNLNQSRSENNLVFQEFIEHATANYTVYPQIEVDCVIALKGQVKPTRFKISLPLPLEQNSPNSGWRRLW